MPNRILREGILSCDRTDKLSLEAELFFRRLISKVDDFGRFDNHPLLLRAALYPLRIDSISDDDIIAWRNECEKAGLVEFFQCGRKECLEILNFRQRKRSGSSKYPRPTDSYQTDDGHGDGHGGSPRRVTSASASAETQTSNECGSAPRSFAELKEKISKIGQVPTDSELVGTPNRPDSSLGFVKDDPIGSAERMLGPTEWKQNARMWEKRFREHPRALALALEDLATQTRTTVFRKGKAAWLTARFKTVQFEEKRGAGA